VLADRLPGIRLPAGERDHLPGDEDIAEDDRSASFVGSVIILVLSLIGGTFIPAESYPPFLRSLAFLTPNGAAQQGLVDILAHGRTFVEVSGRIATTWAWALALMAAAAVIVNTRRTV